MKKVKIIKMFGAALAAIMLSVSTVSASTYQYVTADSLNVRLTPEVSNTNIVKSVDYRERLTVLEKGKEWSKILCANGSACFVSSQYLSDTQPAEKSKNQASQGRLIGYFTISHYCTCKKCNSGFTGTALGTPLTPYYSIAVDPRVIPLGSKVVIDGHVYLACDTGGAIKGNRIDMCVQTHNEAYAKGMRYTVPVYAAN